jgi:hypothetical protein
MKQSPLLTVASLFSILMFSLHLTDDIVRGFEPGTPTNLNAILIFVTWLYGTLVLAGRRSGYVIVLLASIMGTGVPFLHFRGPGGVTGGHIAGSSGVFLWVWTLLALGVSSAFSVILSVQGLWRLRRSRSQTSELESR